MTDLECYDLINEAVPDFSWPKTQCLKVLATSGKLREKCYVLRTVYSARINVVAVAIL